MYSGFFLLFVLTVGVREGVNQMPLNNVNELFNIKTSLQKYFTALNMLDIDSLRDISYNGMLQDLLCGREQLLADMKENHTSQGDVTISDIKIMTLLGPVSEVLPQRIAFVSLDAYYSKYESPIRLYVELTEDELLWKVSSVDAET